ncbi:hypothetical protein ACPEIF_15710 [Streptomyces sp. NPDC012600]|uniref:Uncharacterized protein n=2 Tax=Streptomycetaceae TaxID=2062 RepID=A0ABU2VY17_9ACTN|nr:hypothetical protein [Streptomyces griseus]ARF74393.1 hypothetical protein B7C62_20775 [Kitasatospora albolonga]MDT0489837.1 hypothetical protein [Streptomyces griseus]
MTSGIVATTVAGALLMTIAPTATAGGLPSQAERTARIIEGATGTQDLAAAVPQNGALTASVTDESGVTTTARAPKSSAGEIEITAPDGSVVGLSLPQSRTVEGSLAGAGTTVYTDAAASTDIAVQLTADGGARALTSLKDANAPAQQRYELNLPAGTQAVANETGGFDLVRRSDSDGPDVAIGAIDAPWAKDANGKDVPTSYKLNGSTLIQDVEINKDTAFPVVADPKVSTGWFLYVKFSKSEVKKYESKVKYAPGGAVLCGLLAIPLASVACGAITGGSLTHLAGVWSSAAKYKKCVEMKFTLPGITPIPTYIGAKNYKC